MPLKRQKIIILFKILDVLATCAAFVCAYFLKKNLFFPIGGLATEPNYYIVLLMIIIIWYAVFSVFMSYETQSRKVDFLTVYRFFKAATVSILILSLFMFLFKISEFSRMLIVIFYLLDILFLLAVRWAVLRILYADPQKPFFQRNVLILGSRKTAKEVIRNICKDPESTIKVVGCLEIDPEMVGKEVLAGIKVIGTLDDLRKILLTRVIDEVLITMPMNRIANAEWYLSVINIFGITIRIIPNWYIRKFMASRPRHYAMRFEDFLAEPALALGTSPQRNEELLVKRIFDYVVAVCGLVLSAPLFLVITAAIKLASPGPVIYRQNRCGLYGRRFDVYKFRTMVPDAARRLDELKRLNEASGAAFKIRNDPRIIPYVGRFLRRTGLDELPQLVNVIKGEMSIVGPRPPIPSEVARYELWQHRRLSMRPGITCLWQIQKDRNDLSFDEWMELDLYYIDNWSIWLDFKIIWWTIPAVLFGHGR